MQIRINSKDNFNQPQFKNNCMNFKLNQWRRQDFLIEGRPGHLNGPHNHVENNPFTKNYNMFPARKIHFILRKISKNGTQRLLILS